MIRKAVCIITCIIILSCAGAWASEAPVLTIDGAVEHVLHLSLQDLRKFEPARARLNEVSQDQHYHGAFRYRGPSLRLLLEFAKIKKSETDFNKPVDLAVVVKDSHGHSTVLSWGEIFYRNPSEILVAHEATPVMPHHDREHIPEQYYPYLDQLDRRVGFPKLVVSHDFYCDRSLENIMAITVVDLHAPVNTVKQEILFSPSFVITGDVHTPTEIQHLPDIDRCEFSFREVGDGQGFHGMRHFSGVPLVALLEKAGMRHDQNMAVVISAPDGYRALLSYGELFLSPAGKNIIVADLMNHKRAKKRGYFAVIIPDDLSADRHVKAIDKINVVSVRKTPTIAVMSRDLIGSDIVSIDVLAALDRADAFICPQAIRTRFASYLGTKPVLFDLRQVAADTPSHQLKFKAASGKEVVPALHADAQKKLAAFLQDNKCIAVIGDDTTVNMDFFGVAQYKACTVHMAPASAPVTRLQHALGQHHITHDGLIAAADSSGIAGYDHILQAIAQHSDTLAIGMQSNDFSALGATLHNYFLTSTPVFLIYASTYTGKEKLVKTTMADVVARCNAENDNWWNLTGAFIGTSLRSDAR